MEVPQALEATGVVPEAVLKVVRAIQGAGHQAFLVGGCVRDIVRGKHPKDFDIATSALPQAVQKLFKRVIPTGLDHGTVTVISDGVHVEVTTFRSEAGYEDGRRPTSVAFEQEVDKDLSRRDFTINAMAWDPVRRLFEDPFGGVNDLHAGIIRCVGDAFARFSEDGLRPLRAVRFAAVLDFEVEPATEAAIGRTLPVFKKVALERVKEELSRLLLAPAVLKGLALLRRTGLFDAFLLEAQGADFNAVARTPATLPLRLAALLSHADDPRALLMRLKFPNDTAAEVGHLVAHRTLPPDDAPAPALRRYLAKAGGQHLPALLDLNKALGASTAVVGPRLTAALAENPPLSAKQLALDGKGIMQALAVGPSPVVGEATRHLLELVLDDPSMNSREGLEAALKRWAARRTP